MVGKKFEVIINPASGQNEQILNTLNWVFNQHGVEWQVAVTQKSGDARRLTKEAVAGGADLVAGYGGDGTLMEIANGLRDSDVPLGILPGGTGNNLARELNIPLDLAKAADLLCRFPAVREIDVGQINDKYFLLHAYTGVTQAQIASRQLKDSLGQLAYALPIFNFLTDSHKAYYSMTVDGEQIEQEGIACILLNGFGFEIDLPLINVVNINDGLLDVFLIKKVTPDIVTGLLEQNHEEVIRQWQCREVTIACTPPQEYWTDGEFGGKTPFSAAIAPHPLRVIVPEGGQ